MQTQYKIPLVGSGSLDHFRLNPFRMLHLPVDVGGQEARWATERRIAMSMANIPASEPGYLPFLGECSEAEMRQAVTQLEEPLERLVAELFWFHLPEDTNGERLAAYLQSADASELIAYRTAATDRAQGNGPSASIAERTNLANLDLLLGLTALNGMETGLEPPLPEPSESDKPDAKKRKLKWRKSGNLSIVENPHLLLAKAQGRSAPEQPWLDFLTTAISGWNEVLRHPDWPTFVHEKVARLQDELLDESTAELLVSVIPSRLTDLIATEIKNTVREANFQATSELVKVAGKTGIDPLTWRTALAQTKVLFQNEINQTAELLGNEGEHSLRNVRTYFKSLTHLKQQWLPADPGGLMGVRNVIDDAVLRGFRALTQLEMSHGALDESEQVLDTAASLAINRSVQERINEHRNNLRAAYEYHTCHFCQKRASDPECPVIVKGKMETDRSEDTVHYSIKFAPVARCTDCADLHEFINNWGGALSAIIYVWLSLYFFLPSRESEYSEFSGASAIVYLVVVVIVLFFRLGGVAAIRYILSVPFFMTRYLVGEIMTPKGERRYRDTDTSDGHQRLISEGYDIKAVWLQKSAAEKAKNQLNS